MTENKNDLIELFSISTYKSQVDLYNSFLEEFRFVLLRYSREININKLLAEANGKIVPLMVSQIMYGSILIGKMYQNIPTDLLQYVDNMFGDIKSFNEIKVTNTSKTPSGADKVREIRNCLEHCAYRIMIDPSKIKDPKFTNKGRIIPTDFKEGEEDFLYIRLEVKNKGGEGKNIEVDIPFSDFQEILSRYSLLTLYSKGSVNREELEYLVRTIINHGEKTKTINSMGNYYSKERKKERIEEIEKKIRSLMNFELKDWDWDYDYYDYFCVLAKTQLDLGFDLGIPKDDRVYNPFYHFDSTSRLRLELDLLKEFASCYKDGYEKSIPNAYEFNIHLLRLIKTQQLGKFADLNDMRKIKLFSDKSLFLYIDTLLSYSAFTLYYMRENFKTIEKTDQNNKEPLIPKNVNLEGVNARIVGKNGDEITYSPDLVIDNEFLIGTLKMLDAYKNLLGKSSSNSEQDANQIDEENLYKVNLLSLGHLLEKARQVITVEDRNGVKKDYNIKAEDFAFIMDRVLLIQHKRLELADKENKDDKHDEIQSDIKGLSKQISGKVFEIFEREDLQGFANKSIDEKMEMMDSFVLQIESKYKEISIPQVIENIAIRIQTYKMLIAVSNKKTANFHISNNKDGKDRKDLNISITKTDYFQIMEEAVSGRIGKLENQDCIFEKIFNKAKAKNSSLQIDDSEKEAFINDLKSQVLESEINVGKEKFKVSDYINLIQAVQKGDESALYNIDGKVVRLKNEDVSKILEAVILGKEDEAISYLLDSKTILESNNLSGERKKELFEKLIAKVVLEAQNNLQNIANSKDIEKIGQILPIALTMLEEKNKVTDSSELFRHLRNAFAHGRVLMDFSHVLEKRQDYLRQEPKNIILSFTDKDNKTNIVNFKASMTAETFQRLLNGFVESIDKQIEDRRIVEKHVLKEDEEREKGLYSKDLTYANLFKESKVSEINGLFFLPDLNRLIKKNRGNMREMHIRLKNLGKKTYRKRRNLYKGRLKRKKGIGRKENRRQSIKDFESLVSVTDLMRAMYIKDFDGLVLSEYLPDNEK